MSRLLTLLRSKGGEAFEYLLRDLFTTDVAAGSVNATAAAPGPGTRSIQEATTDMQVIHGKLRMQNAAAWAAQTLNYGAVTRANGVVGVWKLRTNDVQTATAAFAAGFMPTASPADPQTVGHGIAVKDNATFAGQLGPVNAASSGFLQTIRAFKQLGVYLVVALRETGAVAYVTGVGNHDWATASGIPTFPDMRPLWVWGAGTDASVYPYVGSRSNVLLDKFAVHEHEPWQTWYGPAALADTFIGTGEAVGGTAAETDQLWSTYTGAPVRSATGFSDGGSFADVGVSGPTLIRFTVVTGTGARAAFISFRGTPNGEGTGFTSRLYFLSNDTGTTLGKTVAGTGSAVDSTGAYTLAESASTEFVLYDDGVSVRCWQNGQGRPGDTIYSVTDVPAGSTVAVSTSGSATVTNFEVHAVTELPVALRLGDTAPMAGTTLVASDDFTGSAGDLAGRSTPVGNLEWANTLSPGTTFQLSGSGTVAPSATVSGATQGMFYTVPWTNTGFCDLRVKVTPPGTAYAQSERCRGGLVVWQDADNYIDLRSFVDDSQTNSSEYEVVWTQGGTSRGIVRRVAMATNLAHNVQHECRWVFDGNDFIVYHRAVGGDWRPVIDFSLKDIRTDADAFVINRVGISVGNDDTGSVLDDFAAYS